MDLINTNVRLRRLAVTDKQVVARLCNNKNIWDYLRDSFPMPYSEKDAEEFIRICLAENPAATFGINYKGDFAGVVGLVKQGRCLQINCGTGLLDRGTLLGFGNRHKSSQFDHSIWI